VTRRDHQTLEEIRDALDAIDQHLARASLSDGMVFDAVSMRLVEIGEAVKRLSEETRAQEPDIPWHDIAGMRDWLAHRYFDTVHGVVEATVTHDLPPLREAIARLVTPPSPEPDVPTE
jgi:uncharacterized protein with HEPN domain